MQPFPKLAELKLELPAVAAPVANYLPAVRTGQLVALSGALPKNYAGELIVGRVEVDLTIAEAQGAAHRACLALLAALATQMQPGEVVKRWVRLEGYVAARPDFTAHPQVINGASDLLVQVLGEAGKHSRIAVGVSSLPLGVPVELAGLVEVG